MEAGHERLPIQQASGRLPPDRAAHRFRLWRAKHRAFGRRNIREFSWNSGKERA